jgi:glycosyltransferase involved in cell wall biosynthesis
MKILFLTPWYPDTQNPNHGIFIRDQAVALKKKHDVQLISAKIDYSSFSFFSFSISRNHFNGVEEYHILIKRSVPVVNQFVFFLITTWKTLLIARKFSPDLIHGNIGYPGAFWSWIIGKRVGKPYLVTEHTSRFTNNFRSWIHKSLTIQFLKRADTVVSVSNHSADEVFSFIGKRPIVIPNIINFERFKITTAPNNVAWQLGFLGGLNTNTKGLDTLLNALEGITKEFVLHIGGAGLLLEEYKATARRLGIDHKCIFYGFVSHDKVPEFMNRLHFFVSASRFESFGMVIVEAMACGLPIVATNSGGPSDFIVETNGYLVQKEAPGELQKAIENMMENYITFDPVLIREYVLKRYSEECVIQQLNKVYASIAQ